jgi:hypothetical protein
MRWYRALFYRFYCWYRDSHGAESTPGAWAAACVLILHWLNAITIAYFILLRPRGQAVGDLYAVFQWSLPVFVPACLIYIVVFVRRSKAIEEEFENEGIAERTRGNLWAAAYVGVSLVTLAATFVF